MLSERKILLMLCLVAAVRVFIFSAAFPCFNNVDEDLHFDLAIKYSHGHLPRALEPMSAETARFLALFGTPEYLHTTQQLPGGHVPPPLWTRPPDVIQQLLPRYLAVVTSDINFESSNPPLYYAVAALWLRVGRICGLGGGLLLYWLRFLNMFVVAALVWLGHRTARLVFPERPWLPIDVALLLAFFPQDMFYSIQSDVLSPLCFGAAFLGILKLLRGEVLLPRPALLTGSFLAAAWLIKTSNLPLIAVALAAILWKAIRLAHEGKLRASAPALVLLFASAALPIGAWMGWNYHVFGDLTGWNVKVAFFAMRHKSLHEWWQHPLFTWHGLWTFCAELLASFWRGEFVWHLRRIASPLMDTFYWSSSVVLIAIAMSSLIRRSDSLSEVQRQALWLAFWSFAAGAVFLGLISIPVDFGNCFYPSPAYPFFTSGRLMSGALVPFALLFVFGLDRLLGFVKRDGARLSVLGAIMLAITISEVVLSVPAFASQYNWFHFFL
jgi:Predicted membrane protein (DUF2142)